MNELEITRPSWYDYFMQIAMDVSLRSTCLKRAVGAIAVKDRRILATGYNGQVSGAEHCKTCLRADRGVPSGQRQELCRGVHAEQNVICQAAIHGVSIEGCTIYSTTKPCSVCFRMLANCRVASIIYKVGYPDELVDMLIQEAGFVEEKLGDYSQLRKGK